MNAASEFIDRLLRQLPSNSRAYLLLELGSDPQQSLRHDEPRLSESNAITWLEETIRSDPAPDFSFDLLDSALVGKRMQRAGLRPLRGKAVNSLLRRTGFIRLGLVRGPRNPAVFWSVYPEKFQNRMGQVSATKIRDYLEPL
jgi:hypothetical protein